MTVSSNTRRAGPLACNGSLVAFDFDFTTTDDDDIQVVLADSDGTETVLTKTTHYSVALNSDQTSDPGGTITTVSTYASGYTITIIGALAYTQQTELSNLGGFFPKVIERAIDRVVIYVQQLKEILDRAVRLPPSTSASAELPTPSPNKAIGWNATGDALTNITTLPTGLALSSFMETVLDDANAAAARTTLGAFGSTGGTITGNVVISGAQMQFARPVASASAAATIDLAALLGNSQTYTNTAGALTVTSFGTVPYGTWFDLQMSVTGGSVTIQDNASITCITDNDIEVRHLDTFRIMGGASGVARMTSYHRFDGTALSPSARFQPLTASVDGANQLVVTLGKGAVLNFSNGKTLALTAAISVTVPSGATMGTSNGVANRLWVAALYNSGVPELAIINTWDGTDVHMISPTDEITTVATGTGSDSAHTWYSTTLRSSQPIAIAGYVESTQATAGAWATSPSKTQGYGLDVPLPGQVVQVRRKSHAGGATSYGGTAAVIDNTIPQNTEGVEITDLATAITPRSALNLLRAEFALASLSIGSVAQVMVGIFRDSTADAVWATDVLPGTGGNVLRLIAQTEFLAGTTSSTTTKLRVGVNGGASVRIGADNAGAAVFGGVSKSTATITEIQR